MNYQSIIEEYDKLRNKCYKLIKSGDERLLEEFFWLKYAIQEEEINLDFHENFIICNGYTFTTQTMSNEWFNIHIHTDMLKDDNA